MKMSGAQWLKLGMCGKPKVASIRFFNKSNRPKIWHPFRRFSDRNCIQSAIQIKSELEVHSVECIYLRQRCFDASKTTRRCFDGRPIPVRWTFPT